MGTAHGNELSRTGSAFPTPGPGQQEAGKPPEGNGLQLILATGAFALCFAVFGSVSALMPLLQQHLALTPAQVGVALALPVLLGSLGRIPLGMLTDHLGGRRVFLGVMLFTLLPAMFLGWVATYGQLLVGGFFLGVALASFSVGVGFVTGWYPPQRQGTALGIYGAGNIGQSLAAFGAPLLAEKWGLAWGFWGFALLLTGWLFLFWKFAQDAPDRRPVLQVREILEPFHQVWSWILSLYYFLTFGGFVALAIYLPMFLTEIFGLSPRDAGLRTAGFVVLATVMRPVGGWLADQQGGQRVLFWVFLAAALMALCLTCPLMSIFTVGALGMAVAIGLGNGAVFKLVPEYFPQRVGSITGLVGAAGGLGGFLPPLVLGVLRQLTGSFTWGFVLLALFCLGCLGICWLTSPPLSRQTTLEATPASSPPSVSEQAVSGKSEEGF
jgi:NNP family nitrate/nitrite transporter-like MFS transporter